MRRSYGIVGIVALVGISIFFVGAPDATSDPDDDTVAPAESDSAYFQLTATGEGAIPYEELTPEEQADVDRAAEQVEANQGNSVAELAELSRQTAEKARAHAAAMSVGLEGLDSEGVVP